MTRGPSCRKALTRDTALAVQRVVDRDGLVACFYDYDRVRLLRAADGLQAEVGYRVSVTVNEAAQFVIPERVLGRAGEAESARCLDARIASVPNRGLQS